MYKFNYLSVQVSNKSSLKDIDKAERESNESEKEIEKKKITKQ
jgi:hypothetical protein